MTSGQTQLGADREVTGESVDVGGVRLFVRRFGDPGLLMLIV
jgi:hypothetical protein